MTIIIWKTSRIILPWKHDLCDIQGSSHYKNYYFIFKDTIISQTSLQLVIWKELNATSISEELDLFMLLFRADTTYIFSQYSQLIEFNHLLWIACHSEELAVHSRIKNTRTDINSWHGVYWFLVWVSFDICNYLTSSQLGKESWENVNFCY